MHETLPIQELHKSLEALKEEYSTRLHDILFQPLTVENIEHFADRAVDDMIVLVEDMLHEYETNPVLECDMSLDKQQKEDMACQKLEFPNIQEILGRILEVQDRIKAIKTYLEGPKETTDRVITPPDHGEVPITGVGNGQLFEKKKLIPRLLTLMYILQTDIGLDIEDKDQVQILEGEVKDEMMRKTPYVRVTIPDINRAVYICDEEGNVSYVFDTAKLAEHHIPLDDLDIDGKQDKNSLIAMYPGTGMRVMQTSNWRNKVKIYLEDELPEQKLAAEIDNKTVPEEVQGSEFEKKETGNRLPYEEWCTEVKGTWEKISEEERPRNLAVWYESERKNKNGWPAQSKIKKRYEPSGFLSLNILLQVENRLDREFLPYARWCDEVNAAWNEIPTKEKLRDLKKWYKDERKKGHKNTWPSNPWAIYKEKFTSLNEVVGKENLQENEYLSYGAWCLEVKIAWDVIPEGEKPGQLMPWYQSERKKGHKKTWPYSPKDVYGVRFTTLSDVVVKENHLDTKYLPYDKWYTEVKTAWENRPKNNMFEGVQRWYNSEREKGHKKTWPSIARLSIKYGMEFTNLSNVVGIESHLDKEYLPYGKWCTEVRSAWESIPDYERPTSINRWYANERRNGHMRTWPINQKKILERCYAADGFVSIRDILMRE